MASRGVPAPSRCSRPSSLGHCIVPDALRRGHRRFPHLGTFQRVARLPAAVQGPRVHTPGVC
eukprot:9886779-Lingulodinium_polyedra.AAC.1